MPPEPLTMGAIAVLALLANASVAVMLYAFRDGDANMHCYSRAGWRSHVQRTHSCPEHDNHLK